MKETMISASERYFKALNDLNNVFTLDEAGLITRLEGYWDASAILSQIS